MRAFVIAHGRSGTAWTATALRECTGVDARHESMGYDLGAGFGGIEVNGRMIWQIPAIRRRFPGAVVIHLVRDGRDVVRSVLSRKHERTFEEACHNWARRNTMLLEAVDAAERFRLEDLVASFLSFQRLARTLGLSADPTAWADVSGRRVNATAEHTAPHYDDWTPNQRATFWSVCGDVMHVCGYA